MALTRSYCKPTLCTHAPETVRRSLYVLEPSPRTLAYAVYPNPWHKAPSFAYSRALLGVNSSSQSFSLLFPFHFIFALSILLLVSALFLLLLRTFCSFALPFELLFLILLFRVFVPDLSIFSIFSRPICRDVSLVFLVPASPLMLLHFSFFPFPSSVFFFYLSGFNLYLPLTMLSLPAECSTEYCVSTGELFTTQSSKVCDSPVHDRCEAGEGYALVVAAELSP